MTLQLDPVVAAHQPGNRLAFTQLLVDDHDLILCGLREMLAPHRDRFCVVPIGDESDAFDLDALGEVDITAGRRPDVVRRLALIDPFGRPRPTEQRLSHLRLAADRVVYFTFDTAMAERLCASGGADGVISKGASADQLVEQLETVAMGEGLPRPSEPQPLDTLTERERAVLNLVTQGYSNREIAHTMFLSVDTIKTYLRRVYSKLGVDNRTQAALHYFAANQ